MKKKRGVIPYSLREKSVKFDLSWRSWSLIVGFFILIGFVGLTFAYNANGVGGNPAIMGHSADEISGGAGSVSCKSYGASSYSSCPSDYPILLGSVGKDSLLTCDGVGSSTYCNFCCKSVVGVASSGTGADYVTETWKSADGSSWYRKYNSGWIEQGGIEPAATFSEVTKTRSFAVPFTTRVTSLTTTGIGGDMATGYFVVSRYNLTTFTTVYSTSISWYATGY